MGFARIHAILAAIVALPSIALASTRDARGNQTGPENLHQSVPVYQDQPAARLNAQNCYKRCRMKIDPVCDSYGETHGNECAFEIAACEAKKKKKRLTIVKDIHLERNGICGGCRRYEYKLFSELKNFEQARAHCKSQGMDLVMEKTQKIYDDVQKLYGNQQFWVGVIRQPRAYLHFYFVDKSRIWKSHWNPGEPSNRGLSKDTRPTMHADREDCVEHTFLLYKWQKHYWKWNDDQCRRRKKFVCQKCVAHICENGKVCQNGGTCIKLMNQFRCRWLTSYDQLEVSTIHGGNSGPIAAV